MPPKPRAQLALAPALREVAQGRDGYVERGQLRTLKADARRWWTFRGGPCSVQLKDGSIYKCVDGIEEHTGDVETFNEFMREVRDSGVDRPSSYADVFHKTFYTPRVRWSLNEVLSHRLVGGWQQAIQPGAHLGLHRKYDMRSAYLWAGSIGLPDVKSYRLTRPGVIARDRGGVYRVELAQLVHSAPYPFNAMRQVLATPQEIETYGLPVARVLSGVSFSFDYNDPAPMIDHIRAFSFWKQIGRGYWGRWAMIDPIECHVPGKTWNLRNDRTNLVWAHLIISRVRMRVWQAVQRAGAVHVFVDSVITRGELPTGTELGAWKLEKEYPAGVAIKAAGCYGDLSAPERAAGYGRLGQGIKRLAEGWAKSFQLAG